MRSGTPNPGHILSDAPDRFFTRIRGLLAFFIFLRLQNGVGMLRSPS